MSRLPISPPPCFLSGPFCSPAWLSSHLTALHGSPPSILRVPWLLSCSQWGSRWPQKTLSRSQLALTLCLFNLLFATPWCPCLLWVSVGHLDWILHCWQVWCWLEVSMEDKLVTFVHTLPKEMLRFPCSWPPLLRWEPLFSLLWFARQFLELLFPLMLLVLLCPRFR